MKFAGGGVDGDTHDQHGTGYVRCLVHSLMATSENTVEKPVEPVRLRPASIRSRTEHRWNDMSRERDQHCFNCGEPLGCYASDPHELEVCGKAECQREARYAYQCEMAERRERAEQDDYERYGFY